MRVVRESIIKLLLAAPRERESEHLWGFLFSLQKRLEATRNTAVVQAELTSRATSDPPR